MSKYTINGFVYLKCENCKQGSWIKEDYYYSKENKQNTMYCARICEISHRFRNGYSKLKKNKSDSEVNTPDIKKIKIIGTLSRIGSV